MLDEPTSELDPLTEARVLRQLGDAFPDACVVASIHRPSALGHFDSVVYMDEERVIDQGPYADLLARQPGLRALAAQDQRAEAAWRRERCAARAGPARILRSPGWGSICG